MDTAFRLGVAAVAMVACAGNRPPEPPQRLIYLALGASDAAGIGAEPVTRGYVFEITSALDERIDVVVLGNLAVPNAGTEQLEDALDLFFETEAAPGLVTVWTGANDVIRGEDADDFEDDLEDIFETLRDHTDGVIVVANIPDLTLLPRFRDAPNKDVTRERIKEFNEAIADRPIRFPPAPWCTSSAASAMSDSPRKCANRKPRWDSSSTTSSSAP